MTSVHSSQRDTSLRTVDGLPSASAPHDMDWAIHVGVDPGSCTSLLDERATARSEHQPYYLSPAQTRALVAMMLYLFVILPIAEIVIGGLHFESNQCGHGPLQQAKAAQMMTVFAVITSVFALSLCTVSDYPASLLRHGPRHVVLLALLGTNLEYVAFQCWALSETWPTCEPYGLKSMLVVSMTSRTVLALLSAVVMYLHRGD